VQIQKAPLPPRHANQQILSRHNSQNGSGNSFVGASAMSPPRDSTIACSASIEVSPIADQQSRFVGRAREA